jgi:protein TonB
MFGAIVSQIGDTTRGGIKVSPVDSPPARNSAPVPDDRAVPDSRWRFNAFEVWPSRAVQSGPSELSSFTGRSATPLTPLAPPAPSDKRYFVPISSTLRLRGWVRPDFLPSYAEGGEEGSAQLELHIDASGRPIEINLVRGTGFPDLDRSALQAARAWTFSAPLNHARPVSTWAEIEIRFQAN